MKNCAENVKVKMREKLNIKQRLKKEAETKNRTKQLKN